MDVKTSVIEAIRTIMGTADPIDCETTFEGLGADSLDMVNVVVELEDGFDVAISDEEMESLATVGNAVDLVERLVGGKKSARR